MPDDRRRARGRRPARGVPAPPRPRAHRDQVPARGDCALRGHRPPGGDHRGEGLGRDRAAHGSGRRDRRSGRDGSHTGREPPRGARGDLRLDRAADCESGRAPVEGGRSRRAGDPAQRGEAPPGRGQLMRIERLSNPDAAAVRALWPAAPNVEDDVRAIVDQVREGGDAALRELAERFDPAGIAPDRLAVPPQEIEGALGWAEDSILESMRMAVANVKMVAEAQVDHGAVVELADGQYVELADVPVRRAGSYIPSGRAPYPSTVILCAVTARAAGVHEIELCAPPSVADARVHPVILAACALCGVNEVYRVGGAQAIAAMAYGTESIKPVDVIVGPGSPYVQEAKRQLAGVVGIDSIAGPSELVVVASDDVDPQLIAFDLMAQSEHGADSALAVIAAEPVLLDMVIEAVERLSAERESVTDACLAVVQVPDAAAGVALANAIAPEHLELIGDQAEDLVERVTQAGCVFVGEMGATAFGDYIAGSNHVLPTGGAARFASALSPRTFRRRLSRVSLTDQAASRLAPHGAAIAEAEGFPVHGESMERRRT